MQEKKTTSSSFLFFFYFTILYWFCHTLTWILHRCTCVPHPEAPSHLPPHPIPLGHSSVPAPSTLYHTSNLDWWSISHMIILMFQCHSPKSSHPRPLPQSSKDSSIHLCLFCCLAYRVIITIFLLFDHLYFLLFCLHLCLLLLLHLCVSEDTAHTTASLRICAQVHYKGDSLVIFEFGSPRIKLLIIYLEV